MSLWCCGDVVVVSVRSEEGCHLWTTVLEVRKQQERKQQVICHT